MDVLGVTAYGAGSGAALVRDGRVIAAASEAHFTRKLGEGMLPRRAVRSCLATAGIQATALHAIVLHERPLRRFERVLSGQLAAFPRSARSFSREVFTWLGDRLWIKSRLASDFGVDPERVHFAGRHTALAAAAYFATDYDEAAILVVDGDCEWATTSLMRASETSIDSVAEIHHPHSLVLAARAVARWLGFAQVGGEELSEALAARGEARFVGELSAFVKVAKDAHIELDPRAFVDDLAGGLACGPAWIGRFGSARQIGEPLFADRSNSHHADVAASFQHVLEIAVLALARELHRRVPSRRLCFTGALANNKAVVARLAEESPFAEVFVPPWCDDSGSAIGAALHGYMVFAAGARPRMPIDARLGEDALLEPVLAKIDGCSAEIVSEADARIERLTTWLSTGRTVGWVRGRVEYGVGILGSRLVLADPNRADNATHVARAVLRREEFAPCSAIVAAERAEEFFDVSTALRRTAHVRVVSAPLKLAAQGRVSEIVDARGRALVQLVDADRDPELHRLLTRFAAPVLLAMPLAPRGEPVVRGERDAVAFLERSALDVLVVEDRIYTRA